MRTLPSEMQTLINEGGPFTGDNKPQTRITVDPGWWLNTSSGAVGNRMASKLPIRWYQDDANSQFSSEVEIPNLKTVVIDRQLHQVAGTIEIVMYNTTTPADGSAGPSPDRFGDPGHYSYSRGLNKEADARWNYAANAWQNLLRENALLRVYQGYGGSSLSISSALSAGNLILDGVFLIDNVQIDAQQGIITLNGRDMAKLTVDQWAWPPIVPQSFYTSAGIVYYRTGQNGVIPYNEWLPLWTQCFAASNSAPNHPGSSVTAQGNHTYWETNPYQSPADRATLLLEMDAPFVQGVLINTQQGGYTCYVSLWNGTSWVSGGETTPDGVAAVTHFGVAQGEHWYGFPTLYYGIKRVRLEFTNLQPDQTGLATSGIGYYIVVPGDNLTTIAAAHSMTLAELEALNTWIPEETGSYNLIYPGMKLTIAGGTVTGSGTYTVVSGDNLWDIALAHGMTLAQLEGMNTWIGNGTANPLDPSQTGSGNYNLIYPGYILAIAGGSTVQPGYVCIINNLTLGYWQADIPIAGNYNDYADIVSDFLLWSGFWLYPHSTSGHVTANKAPLVFGNIESTGAYNSIGPLNGTFDKIQVSDVITQIAQIVGYIFRVDEIGAARFESPNWWSPGNFSDEGVHTTTIPVIDETLNMTGYVQTTTDTAMVSEILVANVDPYLFEGHPNLSTVVRFVPDGIGSLHGIQKPSMIGIPMNVPVSTVDMEIFAELLAIQTFFANRQGQVTCWHNPAICVDDQIKIFERTTGEANIHYVSGVHIEHDLDSGEKLATYTTSWLGNSDTWVINANRNSILAGSEETVTTYNENGVVISQQLINFLANSGSKKTTTIARFSSTVNNPPSPPAASTDIP